MVVGRKRLTDRVTGPLIAALAKTPITPNALSVLGFLLTLGVAWVVAQGFLLLGGLLVLVVGSFDLLDGALARTTRRASRRGALLDSTLDRLGEAALLMSLLPLIPDPTSSWEMYLIFASLVGSFLVSYLRARSEGLGITCEVGWMRREGRLLLFALGLLSQQLLWMLVAMTLLTAVTVGQRWRHSWISLDELDRLGPPAPPQSP